MTLNLAIITVCLWSLIASSAVAAQRVVSLDQCADQYVLALSPKTEIVSLSPRARAPDSYMRLAASGAPLHRASTETVLAERPSVVVRSWGGGGLSAVLKRRGVRVVQITEADNFDDVRRNIRKIAASLGQTAKGEALVGRMDADLADARGAWRGQEALYLTSGGFTAGRGTLIDAMMRAAGMKNATTFSGFGDVKVETLILHPPKVVVLGFFEPDRLSPWAPGRSGAMRRLIGYRPTIELPASTLGCSGWFSADGVRRLAAAAP